MAIVQQSVPVAQGFQNVFAVVLGVASDLKAGKAASAVIADAVPALVVALEGAGDLSAELQDPQAVVNAAVLFAEQLVVVLK
jgi:hypothetical protein